MMPSRPQQTTAPPRIRRTTTGEHHLVPRRPVPPPVVIAHDCPSAMRAHVLEVPAGRDVLSCVSAFARRGRRGALVLGAAGHVMLRDPALALRGTMEILSLAGCFFPGSGSASGSAVFLAGPRGTVLGGVVAMGDLVAAGPVVVMVATFVAAALDRLPLQVKGEELEATGHACAAWTPPRMAGVPKPKAAAAAAAAAGPGRQ
ncbi:hypothetical protein BAE44_0018913 [Dichanthelium oligosanthes]|uniref:PPC domain-containing protein n=1 Tax=Dichanthelium oligosanthes TaxID=888268 RepID=A0A1E5V4H5_9POAL|nr:hypothetical protein BAE44_0018913 [Dichanthelium oligosanthes]